MSISVFQIIQLQRRAYLWLAETHELGRLGQIVGNEEYFIGLRPLVIVLVSF